MTPPKANTSVDVYSTNKPDHRERDGQQAGEAEAVLTETRLLTIKGKIADAAILWHMDGHGSGESPDTVAWRLSLIDTKR